MQAMFSPQQLVALASHYSPEQIKELMEIAASQQPQQQVRSSITHLEEDCTSLRTYDFMAVLEPRIRKFLQNFQSNYTAPFSAAKQQQSPDLPICKHRALAAIAPMWDSRGRHVKGQRGQKTIQYDEAGNRTVTLREAILLRNGATGAFTALPSLCDHEQSAAPNRRRELTKKVEACAANIRETIFAGDDELCPLDKLVDAIRQQLQWRLSYAKHTIKTHLTAEHPQAITSTSTDHDCSSISNASLSSDDREFEHDTDNHSSPSANTSMTSSSHDHMQAQTDRGRRYNGSSSRHAQTRKSSNINRRMSTSKRRRTIIPSSSSSEGIDELELEEELEDELVTF